MSEDFGNDVDWHAIFDTQCGESVASAMRRQIFMDVAYCSDFLEIRVHFLVAGDRDVYKRQIRYNACIARSFIVGIPNGLNFPLLFLICTRLRGWGV